MSDLYDVDILEWSERQAELLRYGGRYAVCQETIDGQPPLPVPEACPVTLDELLTEP